MCLYHDDHLQIICDKNLVRKYKNLVISKKHLVISKKHLVISKKHLVISKQHRVITLILVTPFVQATAQPRA